MDSFAIVHCSLVLSRWEGYLKMHPGLSHATIAGMVDLFFKLIQVA